MKRQTSSTIVLRTDFIHATAEAGPFALQKSSLSNLGPLCACEPSPEFRQIIIVILCVLDGLNLSWLVSVYVWRRFRASTWPTYVAWLIISSRWDELEQSAITLKRAHIEIPDWDEVIAIYAYKKAQVNNICAKRLYRNNKSSYYLGPACDNGEHKRDEEATRILRAPFESTPVNSPATRRPESRYSWSRTGVFMRATKIGDLCYAALVQERMDGRPAYCSSPLECFFPSGRKRKNSVGCAPSSSFFPCEALIKFGSCPGESILST